MKRLNFIFFITLLLCACTSTAKNIKTGVKPEKVIIKTETVFQHPGFDSIYNYAVGMTNLFGRNFKEAEKFLLKALEDDPDSVYLNYKMAMFYLHFQNISKAVKYCERTLLIKPDFEKAHELLANIYAATNNISGAISEYEFLLNKKRNNPVLLLKYGIFLLRGERFEKAKEIFKQLAANDKYKVMAYYYLGKTYSKIKLFKEAIGYYKKAVNLKPDFEQAYYEMALVYQLDGNDDEAYKTYLKVLKINPDNILAREKIVRFFVKKNDLKGALKHLQKLKELEGDNININIKLALVYIELGKYEKAIDILKRFSEFPKAQYYTITAYLKMKDVKSALKILKQINKASNYYFDSAVIVINYLIDIEKYDKALETYLDVIGNLKNKSVRVYTFGLFLFDKAGKYNKGISFINEALKKFPHVAPFYFYRGVFYDKTGNSEKVIESMKKAIEVNPQSADALNYLGYTYAEKKINLDEAEKLIKKALKISPDSASITDSLGWVYFQQGKYDKALDFLKKAYKLDQGEQAEIIYHIGMTYLKLKNKKLAVRFLKEAEAKANKKKLKDKIKKALEEAQ